MKRLMLAAAVFHLFAISSPALFAGPQAEQAGNGDAAPSVFVRGQRELGLVLLDEASVGNGRLTFRTASGGCTDKRSFRIDVRERPGIVGQSPHYELSIERIARDDCKALLPEGVVIVYDLEKDLGLTGPCLLTIVNPVAARATGE